MSPAPERLGRHTLHRPLKLAVLAACLAYGVHVSLEPGELDPREPWIAAEEGIPGSGHIALDVVTGADAVQAANGAWVPFDEASDFVDGTLAALAELADRVNDLRRIATLARCSSQHERVEHSIAFDVELARLARWVARVRVGDLAPLLPDGPIAVACTREGSRAVRFRFARWERDALELGEEPLADQARTEQTLGALDRAYYRVVAQYRELARLETLLMARPR